MPARIREPDTHPARPDPDARMPAAGIALIYLVVSVLWILFSDQIAARMAPGAAELTRIQTAKGWLFVLGSAALIFVLVSRALRQMRTAVDRRAREEARFRAMIEHLDDVIAVLDIDGTVRYASPSLERVTGRAATTARGVRFLDLLAPEDADEAAAALEEVCASPGELRRVELRLPHSDGTTHHAEVTLRCLLDDPSVEGIVLNARDITEHRRLEQQYRQAQKMEALGRLAGGVVHDFNNALTVIQGCGENVLERMDGDGSTAREVQELLRAARHGEGVVRQLLTFSRQRPLERETINVNDRIREIRKVLKTAVPSRIELRFQLDAKRPWVRIGRDHLEQILMNLVVNARDAMPRTGELVISTRDVEEDREGGAGQPVELSVRDTGVGIPVSVREKMFEPFFTTKPEGEGTGLGLAAVFGTVQQNEGTITFTTAVDQGTTFRIRFPTVDPAATPSAGATAGVETPQDPSGTETILVVDDEPAIRAVAARGLRRLGYTVLEAGDGEEACRVLEGNGRVDMVVADTVMPRMGGVELAEQLAGLEVSPVVLLVSGHPRDELELAEGVAFLEKPYTPAALARRVRDCLAGRA